MTSTKINYLSGVLLVLAAGICWSSMGLGIRHIEVANVWQILFFRSLALTPLLLLVLSLRALGNPLPIIKRAGFAGVIGGISLVFAFLHHAEVFLAAFGLSLFFCYLVAKTQSIKISILAHILNNFSAYLMVTYFSVMIDEIYFKFIKSAFISGIAISGFIIILTVWLIHGGRLKMIVTTIERALMGLQKRVMKTLWQVNNKI